MSSGRESRIQTAIDEAAAAYEAEHELRGSSAYHISKVHKIPLRTVQRVLAGKSDIQLANLEKIMAALGLEIQIKQADKGR